METYQFVTEKNLDQFNQMISAKTRNGFVITEHNEKLPYVVLSKEKKSNQTSLSFVSYLYHIRTLVNRMDLFEYYAFAEEKHSGSRR